MMFDVYTETVMIKDTKGNEVPYELKPLSGRYLPKLFDVMKVFNKDEVTVEDFDEQTMSKLHELALETMKASYPKEEESKLDLWVSQNLLQLIEGIVKVNVGNTSQ